MRIVFFSTNSNRFDGESFCIRTVPSRKSVFDSLAESYPEDEFFVVTQLPASFVADVAGNDFAETSSRVQYRRCQKENASDIAAEILLLNPDLAVAASFWVTPFDWLPVQDGMISDMLRERGVRTLCHPTEFSLDCFDKYRTHLLLEKHGFPMPEAMHLDYQQFWCERSHRELKTNVYKAYVLRKLEKMSYPVVIKDTVGLSSYGMEVAVSYKQALYYLYSGRTNSDRLIEEYLSGEQFGTEIYGSDGNYTVMPPLMFSLNRYGITSPKQSVKLGPVTNEKYKIAELNEMLISLAKKLHLCGTAQVDLVFSGGKWFIIEINPRLSGMSETYAAALRTTVPHLLTRIARGEKICGTALQSVCNIKLPLLTDAQMESLSHIPAVRYIHQIHNTAAKQEREKGYCEIILAADSVPEVMAELERLAADFPDLVESVFLENARALAVSLRPVQ